MTVYLVGAALGDAELITARVVVESGLQAAERVVTVGHIGVVPGGKVRIQEPPAPEATSGKDPGK